MGKRSAHDLSAQRQEKINEILAHLESLDIGEIKKQVDRHVGRWNAFRMSDKRLIENLEEIVSHVEVAS
jgi:hypothetical protein